MAKLLKPFKDWTTYTGHSGIDYGKPTGTPVRSSQGGVIVESKWFNDRSGWMRALKHDNGIIEKAYHLRDLAGPRVGEFVPAGEPWAYVGNSGTITTGPHLHHEIWLGDWLRSGSGYWLYVDDGHYVGEGSSAGSGSTAFPTEAEKDEEMGMKVVRNRNGYYFADEFGGENIATYKSSDMTVDDLIKASVAVFGYEDTTDRTADVAKAVSQRRWNAKRNEIVNETIARIVPLLTGNETSFDPQLIRDAIAEALAGTTIDAEVSDEVRDDIANRVLDKQAERLKD